MADAPNLSDIAPELEHIFIQYPSSSFKCDICANETSQIIAREGLKVEILRIQNREIVPGRRAPYLIAKSPEGQDHVVATTGFHEVLCIEEQHYIDALVFEHFGVITVEWETYLQLWMYPDELEITQQRRI